MQTILKRLLAALAILAPGATTVRAASIPIAYVSFDSNAPGTAQFDIVNLTGINSSGSGDPSFPVTTQISFSNLALTVNYTGGKSTLFNSSYFTLDGDGFSFDGKQLSALSGSPTGFFGAVSAILTGSLSNTLLALNDGTSARVSPTFSVLLTDPSGKLVANSDLAIISAVVPAPEPATWTLLGTGCVLLAGTLSLRRRNTLMLSNSTPACIAAASLFLLAPAASHAATIKLNVSASPSTAAAVTGTVTVTGSGFPSGTIAPANVTLTIASACGATGTSVTAASVQKVIGTSDRIGFTVPSVPASGAYFISISGADSNGVSFTSGSSCSTVQITAAPSTVLTIDTSRPADWKIANGALNIDFNPQGGQIFGIFPAGTTDNLIDLTNASSKGPKGFYMDNSGFGAVTGVPGYVATGSYIDFYETYPSSSANAYTYTEHFVVLPNDSGIHVYFQVSHATTDIAGAIGQVQWVFREDLNKFPNTYSVNADLSNPGPTATPLPTGAEDFSTDPGRAVQDATVDLHGFTDIPAGFTRSFYTKYDYSSYEYLHRAHGVYGAKYGAWVVLPSSESLAGGPTKQNLIFTSNLNIIEAFSGHLDNAIALKTPAGTASNRLFGPFYVRINSFGPGIQTPADMYADAVAAGTSFTPFYDSEAQLVAAGYVPSNNRGSVQVQVSGVGAAPKTSWAVLGDPATNFQYTSAGAQYWADIGATGAATFTGVQPGTYRLSVYQLGKWGELRRDGITVTANQTTIVPSLTFTPENFSPNAPLFTIGTADRSSHEFLHGHDAQGHDDREFWGTWNYWSDFQSNNGAVIYNATNGPAGPATNDLSKWNYNHWYVFNPGLYGGVYSSADDTTDGYKYVIPSYVAALPGATGTNGTTTRTPPWTVHFASPQDVASYSYGVLSVALAAAEANDTITLNGQPLTWTRANLSDSAVRSGLSGYTQWIAFQWDASVLNPAGMDNVLTIAVNATQGVQDDALRFELTNTSADPAIRGFNDYEFLYKSVNTKAADTLQNPVP